ncbi:1-acyl-sn-glycerol-3-phosphate acyltransferase [Catenulispora sp. EB89]|uniref:lysophospholipid acyltransferase family protein n=1 Tax=Catenulispora sp. EB89 TaxID=3156257 RepID=UPI003515E793
MPSSTPYRPPRKQGAAFRFIVVVLVPLLRVLMKRDWRGGENIPEAGGVVIAANHISHVDALAFGHYVYGNGRVPRFLAKSGVFKNKFVGGVLRAAKQIPVYRDSADAANALRDAIAAVNDGQAVALYPEGTITRDPGLWPMAAKSGAARIALATGCPVVPVAQWGAQEILAYHEKRPHLLPRKRMIMLAGPPVDLDDLRGLPQNAETLREATDRIMDAVTELLAKVRGEAPPAVRYVPVNGDDNGENGENELDTEPENKHENKHEHENGDSGKQVESA